MKRYGWLLVTAGVFILTFAHRFLVAPFLASPELSRLRSENAALKTAIAQNGAAAVIEVLKNQTAVSARIFSSFPFNTKSILMINAGMRSGIRVGDSATISGATLVGEVTTVEEDRAAVKTIFDPSWSSAVRIGEIEADGLLRGGANPRISMIAKTTGAKEGESVYSASPLFPYGIYVGTLGPLSTADLNTFLEAPLVLAYGLSDLGTLDILLTHERSPAQ